MRLVQGELRVGGVWGAPMTDQPRRPCRGRHWFTVYGWPGLRAPSCVRCGAPNTRPLSGDEQAEYDYWKANR